VSACQLFHGAAGIGATLAAGMRLSRSFALPAPPLAGKSTPLGCRPAAQGATQRTGGSPRLRFAPKVRALASALAGPFARGLPPGGIEVLWSPLKRRVKTWEGEAPAEPPNAGPRCERLPAFSRSSRDRCNARSRDAAQQELRPPGTASSHKVNAIGRQPAGKRHCERVANVLGCARTFGAKRSRGLPPVRWG
jgi:hypothetical protein